MDGYVMAQILASSRNKAELIRMINAFWRSHEFVLKGNRAVNRKTKVTPIDYHIRWWNGFWRFEYTGSSGIVTPTL